MTPAGVSTSTLSPAFLPESAFPTGESSEMKPSSGLASDEPTTFSSIVSSISISFTSTLQPIPILPSPTLVTISWFFMICSISSMRPSISLCSSFAASYSAFSDKSPCALASLILSAISLRLLTFRSSSSATSLSNPACVRRVFLISAILRYTSPEPMFFRPSGGFFHLICRPFAPGTRTVSAKL